ncbi:MAG: hypothetical protein ACRCT8_01525 [Lacipirellulaceae bacterium]
MPVLLRRIGVELLGGTHVEVSLPIRKPRTRLVKADDEALDNAVKLAVLKLAELDKPGSNACILVVFDADDDCPAVLGPKIAGRISDRQGVTVRVVLPNIEFETWFVGAAASLSDYLADVDDPPWSPEERRLGKKWVADRFRNGSYGERTDQPRLAAKMDLVACHRRCSSFRKLCRELARAAGVEPYSDPNPDSQA